MSNHNESKIDVLHSHTTSFYITTAIVAVLWAGCKNADDYPLPNATPHDPVSASETTEASKESVAKPSSMDSENATIDSQSVASERADGKNHPHLSGSKSDTTETRQESIAEPPSTDSENATIDSQSIASERADGKNHPHLSGSESDTTETRQESIAEPPSTDSENATIDSQSVASERAETRCQDEQKETAEPPLKLEILCQELQEEIQRLTAREYDEE